MPSYTETMQREYDADPRLEENDPYAAVRHAAHNLASALAQALYGKLDCCLHRETRQDGTMVFEATLASGQKCCITIK